jgi:hypothetical protein
MFFDIPARTVGGRIDLRSGEGETRTVRLGLTLREAKS